MRQIRVEDVILQTVATLVNLAGRRLGLADDEDERTSSRRSWRSTRRARWLPLCPEEQMEPVKQAAGPAADGVRPRGQRSRAARGEPSRARPARATRGHWRQRSRASESPFEDLDAARRVSDAVGIFGGSGFYRFLDDVEEVAIDTPYGPPSARDPDGGDRGPAGRVHAAPRRRAHAARRTGSTTAPTSGRCSRWASRRIIGPSACGSLKPELEPGHLRRLRPVRRPHPRPRGHLLRRAADHPRLRRRPLLPGPARRRSSRRPRARDPGRGRRDGRGDPGAALLHPGRVALVRSRPAGTW